MCNEIKQLADGGQTTGQTEDKKSLQTVGSDLQTKEKEKDIKNTDFLYSNADCGKSQGFSIKKLKKLCEAGTLPLNWAEMDESEKSEYLEIYGGRSYSKLSESGLDSRDIVFYQVAMFWKSLGYSVIPGDLIKRPYIKWADFADGSQKITEADIINWADQWPTASPLLLPGSNPDNQLICVDVDDPDLMSWAVETFGPTPLRVETGRQGGGVHLYYRVPAGVDLGQKNGMIGPTNALHLDDWDLDENGKPNKGAHWGRSKIDIKAGGAYLVSPGASHKSGRVYSCSVDWENLTPDFLASLPEFDLAAYEKNLNENQEAKAQAWGAVLATHPVAGGTTEETTKKGKRTHRQTVGGTYVEVEAGSLGEEPFLQWCKENPNDVGLESWWCAALVLASLFGESGRKEFHEISSQSAKYQKNEADDNYTRALTKGQGKSATYNGCVKAGYDGEVPKGFNSPAGFIRSLNHRQNADVASILGQVQVPENTNEIDNSAEVETPESKHLILKVNGHEEFEKALEKAKDYRVLAIKAAPGFGKTKHIASYIKGLANSQGKVLVPSHRRSLVDHSLAAYGLRTDYRALNESGGWGKATRNQLESLGICVDSITGFSGGKLAGRLTDLSFAKNGTVQPDDITWELVVLDESESVFRHLNSDTLKDRKLQTFQAFSDILANHSGQVILADATLSRYSIECIQGMMGTNEGICYIEATDNPGGRDDAPSIFRYEDPESLHSAMIEAVENGPIYISSTQASSAKQIQRQLFEKLGSANGEILLITGEEKDAKSLEFLKDPNAYLLQNSVRAVVCTQALESGLSIEVPVFTRVFHFGFGGGSTYQDLIQMVHRVRGPQEIHAWVAERGQGGWKDEKELLKAIENRKTKEYHLVKEVLKDGKIKWAPTDKKHLAYFAKTEVFEAWSRTGLADGFWDWFQENGYEINDIASIDDVEKKQIRADGKEKREEIENERVQGVLRAKTGNWTTEDARAVMERDHDFSEYCRAESVIIRDFYGKLSEGLVSKNKHHQHMRQTRDFALVHLLAGGKKEGLRKLFSKDASKSTGEAKGKSRGLRAYLLLQILNLGGVDLNQILNPTPKQDEFELKPQTEQLFGLIMDPQFQKIWKLTVGGGAVAHPTLYIYKEKGGPQDKPVNQFLSATIRGLGLKLKRVRKQVDGERTRSLALDLDSVREMLKLSSVYRSRLAESLEDAVTAEKAPEIKDFKAIVRDISPVMDEIMMELEADPEPVKKQEEVAEPVEIITETEPQTQTYNMEFEPVPYYEGWTTNPAKLQDEFELTLDWVRHEYKNDPEELEVQTYNLTESFKVHCRNVLKSLINPEWSTNLVAAKRQYVQNKANIWIFGDLMDEAESQEILFTSYSDHLHRITKKAKNELDPEYFIEKTIAYEISGTVQPIDMIA